MTDAEAAAAILGSFGIGFLVLVPLFLLPTIIAFRRHHPNRFAILAINVALGATGIGWIGSLVWAFGAVHLSNAAGGSHGGESGLNLFVNDPRAVRLVASPTAHAEAQGATALLSTAAAVAEIERLSALRAAGHLNEAEFADLKAAVLRRVRMGAGA